MGFDSHGSVQEVDCTTNKLVLGFKIWASIATEVFERWITLRTSLLLTLRLGSVQEVEEGDCARTRLLSARRNGL